MTTLNTHKPGIDLPAVVDRLKQFLRALTDYPDQQPKTALRDTWMKLCELLMPTGLDLGFRVGCDAAISDSDLSLEVKAALKELLFDFLSPWGTSRLISRREAAILRIRELAEKVAAEAPLPWETGEWAEPTNQVAHALKLMLRNEGGVEKEAFVSWVWPGKATKDGTVRGMVKRINDYLAEQGAGREIRPDGGRVVWLSAAHPTVSQARYRA